jgi:DNA-binding transcriptional LysR family regulator
MELRQLRAFYTITQVSNFTHAAEILGYAQPSITAQIQLLEDELGVKLFERIGRKVILTNEGNSFLRYATEILRLSEEAAALFTRAGQPRGSLSIGAGESMTLHRLGPLLQEYRTRYPEVEIILKSGSSKEFQWWIKNNTIDVAFILGPELDRLELITQPLTIEPAVAIIGSAHPFAGKKSLFPQDLNDQTLILSEQGCNYRILLDKIIHESALHPAAIMESSSFTIIKQFVAKGFGIAFLPLFAVEEELQNNQVIALPWSGPSFSMTLQVCHHKEKWLSSPLSAFLSLVNDTFGMESRTIG